MLRTYSRKSNACELKCLTIYQTVQSIYCSCNYQYLCDSFRLIRPTNYYLKSRRRREKRGKKKTHNNAKNNRNHTRVSWLPHIECEPFSWSLHFSFICINFFPSLSLPLYPHSFRNQNTTQNAYLNKITKQKQKQKEEKFIAGNRMHRPSLKSLQSTLFATTQIFTYDFDIYIYCRVKNKTTRHALELITVDLVDYMWCAHCTLSSKTNDFSVCICNAIFSPNTSSLRPKYAHIGIETTRKMIFPCINLYVYVATRFKFSQMISVFISNNNHLIVCLFTVLLCQLCARLRVLMCMCVQKL